MKKKACLCGAYFLLGVALLIPWGEGAGLAPAEKWVARYDGPDHFEDIANAIAVDAKGNVYVTGSSGYARDFGKPNGDEYPYDFATVKYDANGKQLWAARYNGRLNGYDEPRAIAVDAKGNVYVTGYSNGSGSDYLTIKYGANGKELWVQRYNGPYNKWGQKSQDSARAIAVDRAGNVYVTGSSSDAQGYLDYATIKYDRNGKQLWVKRFIGTLKGNDYADSEATAIALDSSANVYVTGRSARSGGDYVYVTIKYSKNGDELWVSKYKSPYSGDAWASAVAVDSANNIYVTGESPGSGDTNDLTTLKMDANGGQLWVKRYHGPQRDQSYAYLEPTCFIAVDGAGNVSVAGTTQRSGADCDYATIKYNTKGRQLWVQEYDGPAAAEDRPSGISMDVAGNVYVTGASFSSNSDFDYATIKYGPNGRRLWLKRYDGPGHSHDSARAIAVDGSGNAYITGGSYSANDWFASDFATIKY